jgi:hypothetical protein
MLTVQQVQYLSYSIKSNYGIEPNISSTIKKVLGLVMFIPYLVVAIHRQDKIQQDPFANLFIGIGAYLIILGIIGLLGAILLTRNTRLAGWLLVFSGVAGFLLGFIILLVGFAIWVIPGSFLLYSGLRALQARCPA